MAIIAVSATRMMRFKRNFAANLLAGAAVALAQLLFVPFYVRLLGVESYALIGVLIAFQGLAQLLDLGIAATISREVARYEIRPEATDEARHFVRTFEAVYWLMAVVLATALATSAPFIAEHLLKTSHLTPALIRAAVLRMAVVCGLQFPIAFYSAAFRGLQRQVASNVLRASAILLANGAGVFVLGFLARDVVALFDTFAAVNALHVAAVAVLFWRAMPGGTRPVVSPKLMRRTIRFVSSVTLMNVVAITVTHLDKVVAAAMLPLRDVGYYTIGGIAGGAVLVLMAPLFNVIYPAFSTLVASADEAELRALYHQAAQLSAVLLIPPAAVIVAYGRDIILVWSGSADVAVHAAPIAALLIVGFTANGLMDIPYALQLAFGRTSIGLMLAVVQLAVFLPTLFFMTWAFGVVGTATAWPAMNVVYLLTGVVLTHRHLLRGAAPRWFTRDVGTPALAAIGAVTICRLFWNGDGSRLLLTGRVAVVLVLAYAVALLAADSVRAVLMAGMRRV